VNYYGFNWSEELCFGIGCGLGIWYLNLPGISPSRLIHVRSADLEEQFFNRIGIPFRWEQFENPSESEAALINYLDTGRPVLLQTDIYHLPYYQTETHFPGHVITTWGYDQKRKIFLVSDTEKIDLLEVPFTDLRKARYSSHGFFQSKGNLFAPPQIDYPLDVHKIVHKSIKDNSKLLLEPPSALSGMSALESWQNELSYWGDLADWKWVTRFTYQVIEKRGTGGGGFRLLYSRFLKEAALLLHELNQLGLPAKMGKAATAWTELANSLKIASEQPKFHQDLITGTLKKVYRSEIAYHHAAIKM
jgi:hypothetical protein